MGVPARQPGLLDFVRINHGCIPRRDWRRHSSGHRDHFVDATFFLVSWASIIEHQNPSVKIL